MLSKLRIRRVLLFAWFTGVALIAALIIWFNTPWGVPAYHDSLFYLTTAQNIVRGHGISWVGNQGVLKPLTHFPPIYPLALALLSAAGIPVEQAARLLSAILFGLNISLFGLALYLFTRRFDAVVAGSFFFFVSPVLLGVHIAAMAEPLFLLVSFATLAVLSVYLSHPRDFLLVLAALLTGLAYLTRYTGVAIIATGTMSVLVLRAGSFRARVRDTGLFLCVVIGVMLPWTARNLILTGSPNNRSFHFHVLNGDIVRRFLDTIFLWILPGIHSHWIEAGVLIGFCVAFAWLAWRNTRQPDNLGRTISMFIGVLLTFLISYTAILGASLSFLDASTPIDNRILSPLLVAGMMILLLACGYASQRAWLSALAGFALLLGVIIFLSSTLHRSRDLLSNIRTSGAGFTGRAWKTSPLIVWMKTLEGEPTIITNQAMAVQFTTQWLSIQIPENLDPVTAQVRPQYQDELARTRALLKKPDSYLVLFGAAGSFPEPDPGLIAGLEPLLSEADDRVYVDPASRIR